MSWKLCKDDCKRCGKQENTQKVNYKINNMECIKCNIVEI